MKKQNYVCVTLDQYLNENKSITLTRQYGEKAPVVVGSRAPLRNQVLSFVMENQKVTRNELKKFIAGLNEGTEKPAAINMWLKRNEKFFITESKGGITTYKLSKLGEKLVQTLQPETKTVAISEGKKTVKVKEKVEEVNEKEEEVEDCNEESRQERVNKLIEQIKAKRARVVNEAEEETKEEDEDEEKEEDVEDETSTEEDTEEETGEEETEEEVENADAEVEDSEDDAEVESDVEPDDRVEVTEFIITVDDIESAIKELGELGIDASEVGLETDVDGNDDLGAEDDLGDSLSGEDDDLGDDMGDEEEVDDFDLDLGGDIEGEEIEEPIEEVNTGSMIAYAADKYGSKPKPKPAPTQPVKEAADEEDELEMDDLEELPAEGGEEVPGVEEPIEGGDDLGSDDLGSDDLGSDDLGGEGEKQIRVPAADWEKLKGWLEAKGVDIEEMFGGQIEMEGDETDVEDEISFDGLEDIDGDGDIDADDKHEAEESDKEEKEEDDEDNEGGEDEKEEKDEKKDDKKGGFQPGKKGVNPFPKK